MSSDISLWSERQRLRFIERVLFWRGYINRRDLMAFFGISAPQATNDLVNYSTRNQPDYAFGWPHGSTRAKVPTSKWPWSPILREGMTSRHMKERVM